MLLDASYTSKECRRKNVVPNSTNWTIPSYGPSSVVQSLAVPVSVTVTVTVQTVGGWQAEGAQSHAPCGQTHSAIAAVLCNEEKRAVVS